MVIDGFWWFVAAIVGAVIVCGVHVFHLRGWRRERLQYMAWWESRDAEAQQRHEEFMDAMGGMDAMEADDDTLGWNLDGSRVRGQA
jgi:cytochrome c-type biogenesis protein CcmH/NrfG